ncbi:hypothetical protein LTV02_35220 [Nocardia yamanashiensis]|uniref:hypothetical protein n=1 Tax=Nocardia yamanashiensis TaxID=209247 RepID=UPI001E2EC1BD|nr:hypothetical protein [Nocardia yamanashiensis]UGT41144.1 hypothetical protein LTV02_35220 [Nocardia yamanashiensis]
MEIDSAIGELVVDQLTPDAARAVLHVHADGPKLKVDLASDTQGAFPGSSELSAALLRLFALHHEQGTGLLGVTYEFTRNPDDTWAMGQSFDYGDPEPHYRPGRRRGLLRWFGRG